MVIYIYGDVLLLICLLVTVPLLWSVARSYALRFRIWRCLAAGALCAAITYCCIAIQASYILLILINWASCMLLVWTAFGKQCCTLRLLFRASAMLFLEMMTLCGLCTMAVYLFDGNRRATVSLGALIASVALLCIGLRNKKAAYSVAEEAKVISNIRLKIVLQSNTFECDALVDSGNQLLEPISLCPVIFTNNIAAQNTDPEIKTRLVPYKTASGEGLALCQRAESAYLYYNGAWQNAGDIYVAYSAELNCDAIVGYEVFNRITA